MRTMTWLAVLTIAVVTPAGAQESPRARTNDNPGLGPLVLMLPGSTRALGLGNAYPVVSPDPDVIFYNPALLPGAIGSSASMHRFGQTGTLTSVAATLTGGIGFGLQFLEYDAPRGGSEGALGVVRDLPEEGGGQATEVAARAAYARTIKGLRLGLGVRYAQHYQPGVTDGAFAADVGFTMNPLGWLTVSLAAQDIGQEVELGRYEYESPMRFSMLAANRSKVMGPLDLIATGSVVAGPDYDPAFGLGVELGYWPFSGLNFYGRGGLRAGTYGKFTLGGGIAYSRFTLDYAFEQFSDVSDAHRIGLKVR